MPLLEEIMQDVVKTNVKRKQNTKRLRRRRRHMSLYIMLVVVLVCGIGVALSMTLFFNITAVTIYGESEYTNEEILAVSGIQQGDNLVRMDAYAVEQSVLDQLVNVEEVDVHKSYPGTVEITVTKCVPSASIAYDGGYLLVSAKGKIMESVDLPQESLLQIQGFAPDITLPGRMLSSQDEQKDKIYNTLFTAVSKQEHTKIVSVDMTDKYNILVNYEDRIFFHLGNANDIAYKLELAEAAIKELNATKHYQLTMVGGNQISVTLDSESKVTTPPKQDGTETTTTTTTARPLS